ncbi:MAG: hypothetical protein OXC96_04080 [Cyanobacteria bacterium MAG CAR1_bin_15]|nr:hypothetical protein [Cyanobacteria bacterium MAG CAR1_bin_15]
MPTTPPEAASRRTAASTGGRPPGRRPASWRSNPWIPLGPAVAGLALSVGFHGTLRLWEQTRTYKPLDLSPPFAAKPLPGASLENLRRRHGSQLPLLLNPATPPDGLAPPPPIPALNATENDTPQPRDANPVDPATPAAVPLTTVDNREDNPDQNQNIRFAPLPAGQNTRVAPQLPRPLLPTPVEPATPDLTAPPPPPINLGP